MEYDRRSINPSHHATPWPRVKRGTLALEGVVAALYHACVCAQVSPVAMATVESWFSTRFNMATRSCGGDVWTLLLARAACVKRLRLLDARLEARP